MQFGNIIWLYIKYNYIKNNVIIFLLVLLNLKKINKYVISNEKYYF